MKIYFAIFKKKNALLHNFEIRCRGVIFINTLVTFVC